MARYRRQYTLDPEVVAMVEDYANRYHDGNTSAAVEALLLEGRQAQRQETQKSLAYAAIGTATIIILLVL